VLHVTLSTLYNGAVEVLIITLFRWFRVIQQQGVSIVTPREAIPLYPKTAIHVISMILLLQSHLIMSHLYFLLTVKPVIRLCRAGSRQHLTTPNFLLHLDIQAQYVRIVTRMAITLQHLPIVILVITRIISQQQIRIMLLQDSQLPVNHAIQQRLDGSPQLLIIQNSH
jgi:hypothetical protein